jgi:CubicO group peptidase (beta-lactamase class C family)
MIKKRRIGKRLLINSIIITFVFLFSVSCENIKKQEKNDWVATITEQIETWIETEAILSADLLIIRDDHVIVDEQFGMDSPDEEKKLEKNQLFRIHSMTKPITATAIFMLAEEGKIDVNEKVSKYITYYENEKCKEITIKQLLEHTAGFGQPAYPKGSIELYESLEEAVEDLAAEGPKYTPGEAYHYSDGHTATLGLIISRVAGIRAEDFIQNRIFAPLKMNNTYFNMENETFDRTRFCDTYHWKDGRYQKLWDNFDAPKNPFFRASGGVISTISDFAKFLKFWMNKGAVDEKRLLSEEIVKNALTSTALNKEYGWHWEIYYQKSQKSELPVFGHGGSSGTLAVAIPDENAMVLFFTQSRGTFTSQFLATIVLEELGYVDRKTFPEIQLSKETFDRLPGDYKIGSDIWQVEKNSNGLVLKSGRLVPFEFFPVSDTAFEHRYMDMQLKFFLNDMNECDSLLFCIGERKVKGLRQ